MLSCVGVGLGDKVEISRVVSISPHSPRDGPSACPVFIWG